MLCPFGPEGEWGEEIEGKEGRGWGGGAMFDERDIGLRGTVLMAVIRHWSHCGEVDCSYRVSMERLTVRIESVWRG